MFGRNKIFLHPTQKNQKKKKIKKKKKKKKKKPWVAEPPQCGQTILGVRG
jgi:hypothetical protein